LLLGGYENITKCLRRRHLESNIPDTKNPFSTSLELETRNLAYKCIITSSLGKYYILEESPSWIQNGPQNQCGYV